MKLEFVPKRTCGFVGLSKNIQITLAVLVVEKLLIDSYISSKNYKEALILLEKIEALKINWPIKSFIEG
jgi:hypothetical protein